MAETENVVFCPARIDLFAGFEVIPGGGSVLMVPFTYVELIMFPYVSLNSQFPATWLFQFKKALPTLEVKTSSNKVAVPR